MTSSQRRQAHVVDQDPAGVGLDRECERVAQAERPDCAVLAAGRVVERVVDRDRSVGIETEQLALERCQLLRGSAGRLVADRDIELAVLAEVDGPALVTGGLEAAQLGLVVSLEEDDLALGTARSPWAVKRLIVWCT